jgi:hypothetical protein
LVKSSSGGSPIHLPHKFEKKTLALLIKNLKIRHLGGIFLEHQASTLAEQFSFPNYVCLDQCPTIWLALGETTPKLVPWWRPEFTAIHIPTLFNKQNSGYERSPYYKQINFDKFGIIRSEESLAN